jgi:hypothetical protein
MFPYRLIKYTPESARFNGMKNAGTFQQSQTAVDFLPPEHLSARA